MTTEAVEIPEEMIQKWQEIMDLLAEILHVPAVLIVRVEPPELVVVVSSESPGNPYLRSERSRFDIDLYCETVLKTRLPLLIPNALLDDRWKSSPDAEQG